MNKFYKPFNFLRAAWSEGREGMGRPIKRFTESLPSLQQREKLTVNILGVGGWVDYKFS